MIIHKIVRRRGSRGRGIGQELATLSIIQNNLQPDGTGVIIYANRSSELVWDYHSSATAPASGQGDVAAGTVSADAGANTLPLDLSTYANNNYLFINGLSIGQITNTATALSIEVYAGAPVSRTLTGLTDNIAVIGDHAAIGISLPGGVVSELRFWGDASLLDTTYGTGTAPTDYLGGFSLGCYDYADNSVLYFGSAPIGVVLTAPDAFDLMDWSVFDKGTGETITLSITGLPDDGGSPLTSIERQLDGGSWVTLTSSPATGDYDISGLTDGVQVSVAIRAVNAIGNGDPGGTAPVTPTAPSVATLSLLGSQLFVSTSPPVIAYDASVAGTITIDMHSTAVDPGKGLGDQGSPITYAAEAGANTDALDFISFVGRTGYLFVRLTDGGGSDTAPLVSQEITFPGYTISAYSQTIDGGSGFVEVAFTVPQAAVDNTENAYVEVHNSGVYPGRGSGSFASFNLGAVSAGNQDTLDLKDFHGSNVTLHVTVGSAGESNVLTGAEFTVPESAPADALDAQFSVATGPAETQSVTLTIVSEPTAHSDGTQFPEYRVDGGSWTALPSYSGTGAYQLSMAAAETSYAFEIRWTNEVGSGAANPAAKNATSSTASAGATDLLGGDGDFSSYTNWSTNDSSNVLLSGGVVTVDLRPAGSGSFRVLNYDGTPTPAVVNGNTYRLSGNVQANSGTIQGTIGLRLIGGGPSTDVDVDQGDQSTATTSFTAATGDFWVDVTANADNYDLQVRLRDEAVYVIDNLTVTDVTP